MLMQPLIFHRKEKIAMKAESKALDMFEGRTTYTINDGTDEKTTLCIDKYTADLLQENLSDVHKYLQETYNLVAENQSHLSRLAKGNEVRGIAWRKAEQYMPDF